MAHIFITAGLFVLIIVSLFMILLVLMQRANNDGGLGSAFGGGLTESAFGTEAGNVMTRMTRICFLLFFGLAFALYLAQLAAYGRRNASDTPLFEAEPVPAAQTEAAPAEVPAEIPAQEPAQTGSAQ
jgi:preprotein translocase subunit SecG